MLLDIKDIGETARRVSQTLSDGSVRQLLGSVVYSDDRHLASAKLDALVCRTGDAVMVDGLLDSQFHTTCSRCLGPALICIDHQKIRATFLPPVSQEAEEKELSADDLDAYTHDGKKIDLNALVREYLVLAIPLAPLCDSNCQGICSGCGVDLNAEACRCADRDSKTTQWRSALEALRDTLKS